MSGRPRRPSTARAAARAVAAVAAIAAAGLVATAPAAGAASTRPERARAVVVIDTGASVRRVVVRFDGEVSGLDALRLAGGSPVTLGFSGLGAAVCEVDGVGNRATPADCLVGPGGAYWGYFRIPAGTRAWAESPVGAAGTTVHDGDVEGWRFGTGDPPPPTRFCAVAGCGGGGVGRGPADPGGRTATGERAPVPAPAAGGGGSPWSVVVAVAIAGALLAAGGWVRRARRRPAPVAPPERRPAA